MKDAAISKWRWLPTSILSLVVFEARNVKVVDEQRCTVSVAESLCVKVGQRQQTISMTAVSVGPVLGGTVGQPVFKMHRGQVTHSGPLAVVQLSKSGGQLESLVLDVGDVSFDVSDDAVAWVQQQKTSKVSRSTLISGSSSEGRQETNFREMSPSPSPSSSTQQAAQLQSLASLVPSKTEVRLSRLEVTCTAKPLASSLAITGCHASHCATQPHDPTR